MAKLKPLHPGEVLREEFMEPYGLTPYALANLCHIPRTRIERIAREETGITADTALRLAKVFGTTPDFWLTLQSRFEVEKTGAEIASELKQIKPRELVAA
ncbi:addiction module HigA family antidote [Bradyrhizobium diazoefficiens]|jgi:addiction module HigA family antidote|uniref:HigA family addiction module antitoxin n=1 Tax=Bradyrhizobium TaxID=374 RepID=UPI000487D018|nr:MULTISPECIES: HigA family addiction module antitoxin [Bradyrhizobium]MBR0884474.1 HigA family addiction module antidote protein [Bradyrhizobium liaoningense]MBR0946534.1 HigA family addiction module antidote protein [Bradyrhizobium liaoningense]MBR1004618.1 HigA family addiction module antidote protein [Bradyrhizobium liaoningense]MBR1029856.1 HigA family addiction module antidote protein [Bradyrhizobium liaoningense]MBR1068402.1 HigA family addiction module antidote protein [Bradyrhizobium